MKLSIIILSFNTKKLTLDCVKSALKNYKENISKKEIEIIVVDNNSLDGSVLALNAIKEIKLIKNKNNFGFSKGNNIGAKKAFGKYILFLNSDTEVLDNNFLQMTRFMDENPKIGILGAKLLDKNGYPQKSMGNFYNMFNLFLSLIGLERMGLVKKTSERTEKVDWVSGASLMIRSDLFRKLKGFDEKIFMYMEDVELCFRAKKAGYKTYFYPNINLVHKELGSGNRTFAVLNIYKSILHFYKKHGNFLEFLIAKLLLSLKAFFALVLGILTNNNYLKKTYFSALKIAL